MGIVTSDEKLEKTRAPLDRAIFILVSERVISCKKDNFITRKKEKGDIRKPRRKK